MIEIGLYENQLTPEPDDYMAVVQNQEIVGEEEILKEMIVPGGVTVTQAAAVFAARKQAIAKLLRSGKGVHTDYCEIKASVRGVFTSEDDNFSPDRHMVVYRTNPRKDLREIAKEQKVKKVLVTARVPMAIRFIDAATQRRNEVISVGKVGELKGIYLKCDPDDDQQGVFLIKSDGTEVRCAGFINNTSSRLIFFVPDTLTVGEEVEIEVRNKLNNKIKTLRSGRFMHTLSVV